MPRATSRTEFGPYALDRVTRELRRGERRVTLQEKPFRLLLALLDRSGRPATRGELYDALWPADLHVDREAGLNTAVRKLRAALRELSGEDGDILETLPRVGYRLRTPASPRVMRRTIAGRAVAIAVGAALVALLWVAASERPAPAPAQATTPVGEPMPRDPDVRARYVEARALIGTPGGDLDRAKALLRAIGEDAPGFAPAHAYLGEVIARQSIHRGPSELDEATGAAHRALALDPESAVAERVLGMIALSHDWDFDAADERFSRALRLDPADPINHLSRAVFESAFGRHDQAIASVRRAIALDPESMALRSDAGYFLLRAGRPAEAVAECERVLRIDPGNAFGPRCLLSAHDRTGNMDAARTHAVAVMRGEGATEEDIARVEAAQRPRDAYLAWSLDRLLAQPSPPAVTLASGYLALGDVESALAWLDVAIRQRSPLIAFLPHEEGFARLRDDPRYREILRAGGLDALIAGRSDSVKATEHGVLGGGERGGLARDAPPPA